MLKDNEKSRTVKIPFCFFCERLPKRSKIEIRKPKSSVFTLIYKLESVERISIYESKDRLAGFLLLHPHWAYIPHISHCKAMHNNPLLPR